MPQRVGRKKAIRKKERGGLSDPTFQTPGFRLTCWLRISSAHELHDPHREDHLADPKDKHPFDDFCLHFRSVMLRHQSARKVLFLLSEGDFEALGNRPSLIGFNLCALKNV